MRTERYQTYHRFRWAAALAANAGMLLTAAFLAWSQPQTSGTTASATPAPDQAVTSQTTAGQPDHGATTETASATAVTSGALAAPAPTPDNSAERTANEIVAEPDTSIRTTENSMEGDTTTTVAPRPSVRLRGNVLVIGDQVVSETVGVEAAAELLRHLQVVKPKRKPVEEQESKETTPTDFFNRTEVTKLLSENPTVVYQVSFKGTPMPDPMVVPWVQKSIILRERYDEAIELLASGKLREGREALLEIEATAPNSEYAEQSRALLKKLEDILVTAPAEKAKGGKATPQPTPINIHLDPNFKVSTTLIDQKNPEENRVMVNGKIYGPGEIVKGYKDHKIISISDATVTVEVRESGQAKQFTIPVRQEPKQ